MKTHTIEKFSPRKFTAIVASAIMETATAHGAQVVLLGSQAASNDSGGVSFGFDNPVDSNFLVIGFGYEDYDSASANLAGIQASAMYGGLPLTFVGFTGGGAGGNEDPVGFLWVMANPPTGTNTLSINWISPGEWGGGILSFSNVDIDPVTGRINANTFLNVMTADGTPNMNVSAPPGTMVLDFVVSANADDTVGASQTLLFNAGLDGDGTAGFSTRMADPDGISQMIWPDIDDEFIHFAFYLDAIPEPGTATLAMLGLAAMVCRRRRK